MKEADEGVSLLNKLVSKLYNNLFILPVQLELICSRNDTVNYIYNCLGNDKYEFRLVASKTIPKAEIRSKYTIDESKYMCGMRMKLIYTFFATETATPIVIFILGLIDRELPQDSCIFLTTEGLCVGGRWGECKIKPRRNANLMKDDTGYLKFKYKMYRDQGILSFVA